MEPSTGLIATGFGVLVTREVRWFTPGEVPDAVRDWFTAGGRLGFREERLDRYDRPSAFRGIGVKYHLNEFTSQTISPAGNGIVFETFCFICC